MLLGAGDGAGALLRMRHEDIFRGDGNILKVDAGTFLATQWLKLCAPTARPRVQSQVGEVRPHILCGMAK